MRNNFHNSINLKDEALRLASRKAKTQDETILGIFRERKGQLLNPFHIHMVYCNTVNSDTPLTPIRRSISNLTLGGFLLKSESASSKGKYGKPNHVWIYNGD